MHDVKRRNTILTESPTVDTRTVEFKSGESKKLHFAVIGDPCKGPGVSTEADLLALDVPDSFGHRRGLPRWVEKGKWENVAIDHSQSQNITLPQYCWYDCT